MKTKIKNKGFTTDEVFGKFTKGARYLGGGCYSINFFNKEIFATDTLELREKYEAEFVQRDGLYWYA